MNLLPVFELLEFPQEVIDAYEFYTSTDGEMSQDYVEWIMIMSAFEKQSINDEYYEAYRTVTDYLLEQLEVTDLDNDYEYVLIQTY